MITSFLHKLVSLQFVHLLTFLVVKLGQKTITMYTQGIIPKYTQLLIFVLFLLVCQH